jgi:hypothetical protein
VSSCDLTLVVHSSMESLRLYDDVVFGTWQGVLLLLRVDSKQLVEMPIYPANKTGWDRERRGRRPIHNLLSEFGGISNTLMTAIGPQNIVLILPSVLIFTTHTCMRTPHNTTTTTTTTTTWMHQLTKAINIENTNTEKPWVRRRQGTARTLLNGQDMKRLVHR